MQASDSQQATLLSLRDVSLNVPIVTPQERRLLDTPGRLISDLYTSRRNRHTAVLLDRVSFSLLPGDRLGLVGPNGAGKSTLLRVLAGIYTPTSGTIQINGTAKGLFDVTLGMIPDATGLENIYIRALQSGFRLGEIRALVPAILKFSELHHAIEKPVSTYSSGMRLRLATAVSTMIEPDILLLDEWIGAGDARFNTKLKARMMRLVDNSHGLVLATHNVNLMKSLCSRALVLDKGKVIFDGETLEALDLYSKLPKSG